MSLEQGKKLGQSGSVLLIAGSVIPFLSLIGIVLMFKGMTRLSDYYDDEGIRKDAPSGFRSAIISLICFEYILMTFLLGYIFPNYSNLVSMYIETIGLTAYGVLILGSLFLGFVSYIFVAAYFITAFSLLGKRTGQKTFRAVGLLFPIAAIVTMIGYALGVIFAYMPQIIIQEYMRLAFAFAGPAVVVFTLIVATIAFTSIKTN